MVFLSLNNHLAEASGSKHFSCKGNTEHSKELECANTGKQSDRLEKLVIHGFSFFFASGIDNASHPI